MQWASTTSCTIRSIHRIHIEPSHRPNPWLAALRFVRAIELRARRIAGFGLTSPNVARLTEFYERAFGARHVSSEHLTGARFERQMGVRGGALRHTLQLGHEAVDILQFDTPGRPYPRARSPGDTAFQHFALVVSNMDRALAQLQGVPGWTPISIGGPQRLPQRTGGVTAFKFQDPDGHPLELLAFPEDAVAPHWKERSACGIFLGVDHSAISVRDTAISTAFYQSLGFTVIARSFNHGVEQANLDGVPSPRVEVTALSIAVSTPHLELLCYRSEVHPPRQVLSSSDVAATRIALAADCLENDVDAAQQFAIDPDGHHLLFVP
jgi:catechol 2,3-dioxygenase-like lactoylglutathione lyase family enzyme